MGDEKINDRHLITTSAGRHVWGSVRARTDAVDTAPPVVRVLLVDDSRTFLDIAETFLGLNGTVEIIGRAMSGGEALELVERLAPDLVLMDLAMPGMNGLEATRQLKACNIYPRVVILTLSEDIAYQKAAEEAGADGFIPKTEFANRVMPLLTRIMMLS